MCRHECTSRRVQRKLLVMGVSLTVGSEGEFKRGSSGGPKLITALTALSSFHSLLDYATSIYINGFIHLRSWSDLQFPALEIVVLWDIVDVHDESIAFFLPSGPAGHLRLVGLSGLRALPFLSLLILNSYAYLRPLKMAGAHVLTNPRNFVISGGTFNTADTVSRAVR